MMLRRLAALAALPVIALSLAAAPAMAADPEPPAPPSDPRPAHVWICADPADISVDLGGLLGLHVDLDLLHPWHGHYCGWVPVAR
ncbi:hypothetical protein [Streptomyces violaceusniger]|uniref:Secreted protein n=1 Tax=Streptomyces violaceusniger (strain Tu 4113) TaxID=653045 RepID=G2PHF2_STRV4|nr:hypothetical protein [Streptomyces violaceusniger]AEM88798.1 hypothetical protein Strvi_0021 [Streptomyces violaceusniger Tu 4113]